MLIIIVDKGERRVFMKESAYNNGRQGRRARGGEEEKHIKGKVRRRRMDNKLKQKRKEKKRWV